MSTLSTTSEPSIESKDTESCVFKALLCYWIACNPSCGCRGSAEFCCMRRTFCFELCGCNNVEPRGVGLVTNSENSDEICKLGFYCCDYALIYPRLLCAFGSQGLCIKEACSFPCHEEYMDEPMCALYCISCYPTCGTAVHPPKCRALENLLASSKLSSPPQRAMMIDRGDAVPFAKLPVAESFDETEIV